MRCMPTGEVKRDRLRVFVSSTQRELEDERLIVQNLLTTDAFLEAHFLPVLYEFEPASPEKAAEGCLRISRGWARSQATFKWSFPVQARTWNGSGFRKNASLFRRR